MQNSSPTIKNIVVVFIGVLLFMLIISKLYTFGYEYASRKYNISISKSK